MRVVETALPEVLLVEPDVFGDERGFFQEIWRHEKYIEAGIAAPLRSPCLAGSHTGPEPQTSRVSVDLRLRSAFVARQMHKVDAPSGKLMLLSEAHVCVVFDELSDHIQAGEVSMSMITELSPAASIKSFIRGPLQ